MPTSRRFACFIAGAAAASLAVSVSGVHTLAARSTDATASGQAILTWGDGNYGELGNGGTAGASAPVSVSLPGGTTVTAIASGGYHNLAVTSTGSVLAWGDNQFGELGNGTTTSSDVPVPVSLPSGTTITGVAAGQYTSFALTSAGAVLAWGYDNDGELGNGSPVTTGCTCEATPVAVKLPGGTTVNSLAAGSYHALALTSSGGVYAWGFNGSGQLGDSSTATSASPKAVKLPGGTTVTDVAAGGSQSLAVTSTGGVLAWGDDFYGELGNGKVFGTGCYCSSKPVTVNLPSGVRVGAVAAGFAHSVALTTNGVVLAWGAGYSGQLGIGKVLVSGCSCSSKPVTVKLPHGSPATAIASGAVSGHSLASLSNGTVYAWGYNGAGELGNGTATSSGCYCQPTPVAVSLPSGTQVTQIAAGAYHSLLLDPHGATAVSARAAGSAGAGFGPHPVASRRPAVTLPQSSGSSVGLFATDYKPTPPRTIAQWQAAARNFDVLIGMPDVYAPYLHLLRATNPNLTILFYNIGPYLVTTSADYPQIATSHPDWFAHDTKGNRIYATAISHPAGTMYLMEQSSSAWRSWEVTDVTSVLGEWNFDGVDVDNMGWGATMAYDDAVPVNPSTGQPYTTPAWLGESVQTLNAIKAGVGSAFVMFNGLTNGPDYYQATDALAQSNADGGMSEEFIREATSPLSAYPSVTVWQQNLTMITNMESLGKYFFAWTKTWNTGSAAQIAAWNTFAEATYLLGNQSHSYYDFLPTTTADRTVIPYPVEQAALGAPLGAYTVSNGIYQRAFQNGEVKVDPGADTASITVSS